MNNLSGWSVENIHGQNETFNEKSQQQAYLKIKQWNYLLIHYMSIRVFTDHIITESAGSFSRNFFSALKRESLKFEKQF